MQPQPYCRAQYNALLPDQVQSQVKAAVGNPAAVLWTVRCAAPTSFAFSCWISDAMALITALLLATRLSWGRMTTRAAAVAKCSAARVFSAEPAAAGARHPASQAFSPTDGSRRDRRWSVHAPSPPDRVVSTSASRCASRAKAA